MKTQYKLINPSISGTMETSFNSSDPKKAAKRAYKHLSDFFFEESYLPQFHFTLQNEDKLYHFQVNEKKSKKGVAYKIVPYRGVSSANEDKLKAVVNNKGKMKGGDSFDDFFDDSSDSSSSSDDDFGSKSLDGFNRLTSIPIGNDITKFWYTPIIYPASASQFYVPVFKNVISPLIKFELELNKYLN